MTQNQSMLREATSGKIENISLLRCKITRGIVRVRANGHWHRWQVEAVGSQRAVELFASCEMADVTRTRIISSNRRHLQYETRSLKLMRRSEQSHYS